jgi:hypothetical protein
VGLWQPSWNEVELFRTAEMYRALSAVEDRDRGVVVKGVDGGGGLFSQSETSSPQSQVGEAAAIRPT